MDVGARVPVEEKRPLRYAYLARVSRTGGGTHYVALPTLVGRKLRGKVVYVTIEELSERELGGAVEEVSDETRPRVE